ncbi:penicillin acylase family protein [Amycolatopsis minnesotensis]|uniref:Acylase n=1 Tax=Amycolatopsis minnesotensis TaxID=337894 RepID=A0ABN2SLC1_9PSEU
MRISWDRWAVPTVTGDDEFEVTFGVGYAQAMTNATQVLEIYGIARGTAAALWGPRFVAEDTFTAELGLAALTGEWFEAQAPETLARIAAFCDGFNEACADDESRGTVRREALPVTPRDVIAQAVRLFTRFSTVDPGSLAFSPTAFAESAGSNGWAISGKRSSTGNAMLVINPHLMWRGYQRWFEVRAISPGRDFHGAALLGLPWQNLGYNPMAGWGHTMNPIPNRSVYEVPVSTGKYRFDGQCRAVRTIEHELDVAGEGPVTVLERRSVHGPIVTAPDGTEVAVRIAGVSHHPATSALESWWRMSLAGSVAELVAVQDELPLPMFTLLAADAHGSIAAMYCGTPPVRATGDFDDSRRRLPGDDPRWLWDEVHPAGAMPRVIDPDCGWVQNCNETPWHYTDPPLPQDAYPPAIAPGVWQVEELRSAVSRSWLAERDTISPQDLLDLKFGKRALLADIALDDLCRAASPYDDLHAAVEVLSTWDRHAQHDSRGYVLFWLWALFTGPALLDRTLFTPVSEPGAIPGGLADAAATLPALRLAIETLAGLGLPLDAAVGEVRALDGMVPADGGSGALGIMKSFELTLAGRGIDVLLGDTWISLVQFQPDGRTTAESLLVYGNTTEPGAPPSESQYDLWADDQLRVSRWSSDREPHLVTHQD